MNRIVVLGCGAVGRPMAIDLCKAPGCEVITVDVDKEGLERLAQATLSPDINCNPFVLCSDK